MMGRKVDIINKSMIFLIIIGLPFYIGAEDKINTLENLLAEPSKTISEINKEDEFAKQTIEILNLHDKRLYQDCSKKSIESINASSLHEEFVVFQFMYGTKCLAKLSEINKLTTVILKGWVSLYFSKIFETTKIEFHGPENDIFDKYHLQLSEILYLNYDKLDLDQKQLAMLETNLKDTDSTDVIAKLFQSYSNRNDQVSAKSLLEKSDPNLQDIKTLEMLYEHFKDDVYQSRIDIIKKSKTDIVELKRLYNKNKDSEFLTLLNETNIIGKSNLSSVSRQLGWLFVRGKQDFRDQVINFIDKVKISYNQFFWVLSNQGLFNEMNLCFQKLSKKKQKSNLSMALKSYLYSGDYEAGFKFVESLKLLEALGSTRPAVLFYSSLIYIRYDKDKMALPLLKQLADSDSDYKLQAMYISYNILKDLKKSTYKKMAKDLVDLYPLTYYALVVAHEEKMTQDLPFFHSPPQPKIEFKFDQPAEKRKLKHLAFINDNKLNGKFRKFMESTLTSLSFESQLVWAYFYETIDQPLEAIKIMNQVWTSKRDWIHPVFIPLAYPTDYLSTVNKHAVSGVDPLLVLGLIRQESAFQKNAKSPSSARGLMQLLTATARETARALRLRKVALPWGLYSPEINIKIGSFYLKRRIAAYKGHIPMALASYNVGPGRLQKWSEERSLITQLQENIPSNSWKLQDLWVEEMPWDETRFYVKAVLRNYFLYKVFQDYKPLEGCYRLWNCNLEDESKSETVAEVLF